jgi:folylpolyglutamate synthase/dihydropteroate synthase
LILTKPENSRAAETAELLELVPDSFDRENLVTAETVAEALAAAARFAGRETVCVTGSLYLVGEAQRLLRDGREH